MITNIEFSEEPFAKGEQRILRVWSDAQPGGLFKTRPPITVEIECFREPPTPAEFRPCSECGKFRIISGEAVTIAAPARAAEDEITGIIVRITDEAGDSREFRLGLEHLEGGIGLNA